MNYAFYLLISLLLFNVLKKRTIGILIVIKYQKSKMELAFNMFTSSSTFNYLENAATLVDIDFLKLFVQCT